MSSESGVTIARRGKWLAVVVAVLLMLFLRCVALDSDAYPRLSWSSALLTDEGFYLHNARNRVLFGHAQTDQFNNALIMPLLDALQTGLFRIVGVGAVQARALTVVLGLLTLPVFYDALRRAFGLRTALLGLLLLGLDHVSLLYGRLALMDTPAAFVLVCGFWLWVKSGEDGRRGRFWLAGCGVVLGLCYGVRGLGALVYPVPALLLGWEGWKARHGGEQGEGSRGAFWNLAFLLGGLALALGVYGAVWYLPHRAELARVNHYYLFDQLLPHSFRALLDNWWTGLFGDHRGLMPYLFRHEPVQTCLVLLCLAQRCRAALNRRREPEQTESGDISRNADFLIGWLAVFWLLLCSIGYAPSRYYVLFLPAFYGLAGLTLSDVFDSRLDIKKQTFTPLLGLFVFHAAQSALHHLGVRGVLYPSLLGVGSMMAIWLPLSRRQEAQGATVLWRPETARAIALGAIVVWGVVNLYWTGDWLLHLTYRQRDADRWLANNLPVNSVLIGAVAPGLTLNSRFVCVSVIDKLCNDQQPVEKYAPSPRYVLILDDRWREVWWQRHYPELIAPTRRIHAFRGLLRPFFVIGLYRVPDRSGPER